MNNDLSIYFKKLIEYLATYGIHTHIDKYSKCPLKDHKTAKPFKLGIGSGGDPVWICFACGEGGTIFDLVASLQGYPKMGDPDFYSITVRYLSDLLSLPFPEDTNKNLSPQDRFKIDLYNLTREISNNLSYKKVEQYAARRGWGPSLLREFNVGGLLNYDKLLESFRARYSDKVLKTVGFLSKYPNMVSFFKENRIIFTIHDSWGKPIGFTSRLINYTKGTPRKYVNSSASPIFHKRNVLYNMHRARKALLKDESKVLYLVEGQADALTLYKSGIHSVLAISGASFTDQHMSEIEQFDLVVGCMDSDLGGERATRKLYSKYLERTGKDLYLLQLPDAMDPDDYINKYSVDSFLDLEPKLPIEWEILNEYTLRGKLLADYWLPRIGKVNSLYHEKILKTLSIKSGISLVDLQAKLNSIVLGLLGSSIAASSAGTNLKILIENKETY